MLFRVGMLAPLAALILAAPHVGAADPDQRTQRERGWNALRAMDCARCHGRDHDGWAAPSLIAGVRDGSRERFDHWVLDGDIGRGMPGYRSQPLVVAELDAIYAYLLARARGDIGPGRPSGAAHGAK
ncbi:MAG TPA: cytochrome c [Burkholderiaceae bacterium]|nr:cytochrome c [Burkholderiaceae bacterium]